MRPFSYQRAESPEAAVAARVALPKAKFLGGGTNLVDLMKDDVETPEALIDVNGLKLTAIEMGQGVLKVGALVRNSDLAEHEAVRTNFSMLSEALLAGASPQIRNAATVGGNLLQRTRCPYFIDLSMACNKREPGSGCSAINGYDRSLAVLGGSALCAATHPSDMAVALAALGATVRVLGPKGARAIPFAEFHKVPADTPHVETSLAPDELIVGVDVPNLGFTTNSTYLKVRDRASYAFALASAAVALSVIDGTINDVRIALGGVGTKPWRSEAAEKVLLKRAPNAEAFRDAAEVAFRDAKPLRLNGFKVELGKRTLARALAKVAAPKK